MCRNFLTIYFYYDTIVTGIRITLKIKLINTLITIPVLRLIVIFSVFPRERVV